MTRRAWMHFSTGDVRTTDPREQHAAAVARAFPPKEIE